MPVDLPIPDGARVVEASPEGIESELSWISP